MSNIMQRQVYCLIILERFVTWFWLVASSFKLLFKTHVFFSGSFHIFMTWRLGNFIVCFCFSFWGFFVVLQFSWQELSKITTKINKMRHINFSKVALLMLYMSECFKKGLFFVLCLSCHVLWKQRSTNKQNKENSPKKQLKKAIVQKQKTFNSFRSKRHYYIVIKPGPEWTSRCMIACEVSR